MDVENLDGVRRNPVEDFVGIADQGNNPNAWTLRNLSRACRPLADPPLDRMQTQLKGLIRGWKFSRNETKNVL